MLSAPGPRARRLLERDRMRMRYILTAAGIVLAAVDTVTLVILGVTFAMNGRDVSQMIFVWFGSSFAILGWLLGWALDTRRRERAALAHLDDARERIAQAEKLAVLGQLTAAIAHEVRNPLAIIRSSVQNASEALPPNDAQAAKSCTFAIEEIDRLTRVTNTLLGFARPIRLNKSKTEVGHLFDRTEVLARRLLEKKQQTLERASSTSALAAELDADLVCQVLLGLIANAAEATPARGRVILEATKNDQGKIELAVADSGPGVPAELRDKIFDPFVTTRADGTGLGLAVARQIVEAHGGKIAVGDRAGGGARFAIMLEGAPA